MPFANFGPSEHANSRDNRDRQVRLCRPWRAKVPKPENLNPAHGPGPYTVLAPEPPLLNLSLGRKTPETRKPTVGASTRLE